MKKLIIVLLVVVSMSGMLFADDAKYYKEVLATVGDEPITFEQLERSFKRNMNNKHTVFSELDKDSLYSYLDLYIQYRLIVQYAKEKKYDTLPDVIRDNKLNRSHLAESYYFNEHLIYPFINKQLERRKTEKTIAIIMQSYSEYSGGDSTACHDTLAAVLKEIKDGGDFAHLARLYSVDKATGGKGGVMDRWVTAGTMAEGLIEAVYDNMKPGDVYPELINDRKMFFIMKLLKSEPRKYVLGSHILIRNADGQNSDSIADVVLEKLNNGEKFKDLVKEYSQDPASVKTGGSLRDFYSRSTGFETNHKLLLPKFQNALFALKEGEISGKVKTERGIHIIRCDSIKDVPKEDDFEELKSMYRRLYFTHDKEDYLDSLTGVYGYELHKSALADLVKVVDTTKTNLEQDWERDIPSAFSTTELFKIHNQIYTVKRFVREFNENPEFRGFALSEKGFLRAITNIVRPLAFELETADYESKNKEFELMVQEFYDGSLKIKAQEDEIWNKSKFDTVKARAFYKARKDRYKTDYSYDLSEILVFQDSVAKDFYKQLKDGKVTFEELAKNHTQRSGKRNVSGHLGIISAEKDERAIQARLKNPKKGEILEPIKLSNGIVILKINEVLPVRQKTFEEAIPDFSAEFQEYTQNQMMEKWISSMKENTKVDVKKDTIKKIFKN